MKHDSAILKEIKAYFMRRKSVKDAYSFERKIESDKFLYTAVVGFEDMLTSDIQQALDELDDQLDKRAAQRLPIGMQRSLLVGAGVLALVAVIFGLSSISTSNEENQTVKVESTGQSYLPRQETQEFSAMDSYEEKFKQREEAIKESQESPIELERTNEGQEAIAQIQPKKSEEQSEEVIAINKPEEDAANDEGKEEALQSNTEILRQEKAKASNAEEEAKPKEVIAQPIIEDETTAVSLSQPSVGFPAYKKYLRNSVRKSSGMPSGSVVVSFEFDREGNPKKIVVEKSLCTTCDLEAIRLIENGPNWNVSDRKKRQSVSIEF